MASERRSARRRWRARSTPAQELAVLAAAGVEESEDELVEAPVAPPLVRFVDMAADRSVSATVYALLDRGAAMRPALAAEMRGSVLLRFDEDYHAVRIDFLGDEIHVQDDPVHADRAFDLVIRGALADVVAVMAAPLTGGLPRPTHKRGRAAIARLADGRVDFDGPLALARRLLKLMAVEPY